MARSTTTSGSAAKLPLKRASKSNPACEPFVPGPNPKLPQFIAEHSTPYDPATDTYEVPAFDRDLIVDKAAKPKAIYDMHMYWSKKHWASIREYLRHYLPEKYYPRGTGLVLDCFSGSGMTGVAAMMEDRPCVLIDASPAAAFISHCCTHPVDPEELQAAYDRMMTEPYPDDLQARLKSITGRPIKSLTEELDWLYETRCDRCGGKATTDYVVYSERFQCPNCAQIVALFDCPEANVAYPVGGKKSGKTRDKRRRVCPYCLTAGGGQPHRNFAITTRGQKFGPIPVSLKYRCLSRCRPAAGERSHQDRASSPKGRMFRQHDLQKISDIESLKIPHWFPQRNMMDCGDHIERWGVKWRAGTANFKNVFELYTKRNVWALAAIRASIERETGSHADSQVWKIALTAITLNSSRMYRYRPSGKGGLAMGTYYVPQLSQIMHTGSQFKDKSADVINVHLALLQHDGQTVVSTQDSRSLVLIDSCLDYVFIDPPYLNLEVQYGELNFIWEAWLSFGGDWRKHEIVLNPFRMKSADDWEADMRSVIMRCETSLKPGRWMSICYHEVDPMAWVRINRVIADSGFEIHTVNTLDPIQKTQKMLTMEKVFTGDLVINCRKPKTVSNSAAAPTEAPLVSARVRDILIETLSHTGGQTRDKLWDTVLKRLLTRGQMAEHRFDDILAEVAFRSEAGRWFLRDEFEQLSDNDVKNEERAGEALTRFARLRMAGVPAQFASEIALHEPKLCDGTIDEEAIERHIHERFLKAEADAKKAKLGGRMRGIEFYDCLFFYLTRWLKGRAAGTTPRRNLADFLDEYLVRFKDGDKWLYRVPDDAEAKSLRTARQTGLGRRIRQFVAYLNGEGDFPKERMPDGKTLVAWLKHCAAFGLPDEGVALFEKGGLAADLARLGEDDRYDAEDYYSQCKRRAAKDRGQPVGEEDEDETASDEESEA